MANDLGRRLLPSILHHEAKLNPRRVFAVYAEPDPGGKGDLRFVEVSYCKMAQAVNYTSNWLQSEFEHGGKPRLHETIAYIGVPDLRYNILFYAAIQCRYKVFLPSPRNSAAVNSDLLRQLSCTKLVYTEETASVAQALQAQDEPSSPSSSRVIPSLEQLLAVPPSEYPYDFDYVDVCDEPILVLHSSGSTGQPKPVISTHAALAVCDVRDYPTVPGRVNHDVVNAFRFPGSRVFDVFPPFHLAGFVFKLMLPLFTLAIPIFALSLRPPSGSLAAQIIRLQKPRGVYLPPSIIEQVYHEPDGMDLIKDLDILLFAGGPLASYIGNEITKHTQLGQIYGSTEAGQMHQLRPQPDDWEYFQFHSVDAHELQPEGDGSFELVMFPTKDDAWISQLYHNYPDIREWRTKDLFIPHPSKAGLWRFYARKDDILVLSSGEKLNPVSMEGIIGSLDGVNGALVVGARRSRAALLVELKENSALSESSNPLELLWPAVVKANESVPTHGYIAKSMIVFATADKPFKRAGKGTVVRRLTEELYADKLANLYASQSVPVQSRLAITLKPSRFAEGDVKALIRSILAVASVPEPKSDEQNFFSSGLDSVKTVELVTQLRASLAPYVKTPDELRWISLELVFRNPTVDQLSGMLLQFLNHGATALPNSREAEIQSTINRYISGLPDRSTSRHEGRSSLPGSQPISIAITGTTGYFGSFLLRELAKDTRIARIFALNRSTAAAARYEDLSPQFKSYTAVVKFVHVDLSRTDLGLSSETYADIQGCDAIIHNAWQVDFNLPITAFEDNIRSVRSLVDLGLDTDGFRRPRIIFISSIAATGVWARRGSTAEMVPTDVEADPSKPLPIGYAESKYVAEHILDTAAKKSGLPVTIVRTGQIYPSTEQSDNDTWPRNDTMGIFLLACKALGAISSDFQEHMTGVSVNWATKVLCDLVHHELLTARTEEHVYNLVHPDPLSWSDVFETVRQWCGGDEKVKTMDMQQWVALLTDEASLSSPQRLSALRILTLYELMAQRGPMHTHDTSNLLAVGEHASEMPSADPKLMRMWLERL